MIELRPFSAIAAALLGASIGGCPALAQSEGTAPPAQPVAAAEAESASGSQASVADIAGEVDENEARLREIRSSIEPEEQVEEIAEQLDGFTDSLQVLQQELDDRILSGMSLRGLADLRSPWNRELDRLQGWDTPIQDRSKSLADQEVELRHMVEYLRAAGGSHEVGLPAPLVERIGFLLLETVEVQGSIALRLAAVLTLRDRITEMERRCAEAIERIDESQREARQQMFSRNQPPLWSVFGRRDPGPPGTIAESWLDETAAVATFARQNAGSLLFQLALFVVLAVLINYLHRRSGIDRQAATDESLAAAALVLARPLSAALLLTLFCTRLISPQAPTAVFDLNRLLFIIPLLRFVPPLVPSAMVRPLYGLFTLYVVHQVLGLAPEASPLRRLMLLGTSSVALAGIVWLAKLGRQPSGATDTGSRDRWRRAGIFAAWIVGLLLVVALLANVLGRVRLAALLTETSLVAAYVTVGAYAVVRLIDSMTTVLLGVPALLALNVVRGHSQLLKQRISMVVRFAMVVAGLGITLQVMDLLAPVLEAIQTGLDRPWSVGAFQFSLGDLLAFGVSGWLAFQVARFIRFAVDEDILPRLGLPRGVPQTVSMLVYYSLLAVGFLVALGAAGIELSRLTLVIGALGVGIGFGLQNMVNNFVSGLILIFERPIKIGDVVEVGPLVGEVRRIGIRSSVVRTFSGSDVIVPNGNLISQEVVNWTLTDSLRRIEIPVGVAYDSDPTQALRILVETARAHEEVLKSPEPHALAQAFGRDAVELELRFWSDSRQWLDIKSEVIVAIHEALDRAGITIAFPRLDLHVRPGETPGRRDAADPA